MPESRQNPNATINRRSLLLGAVFMLGGAAALTRFVRKPAAGGNVEAVFSPEQFALLEQVVDVIIPRTDTPGARDVGVPAFIDVILKDAYPAEDQARFVSGLKDFEAEAQRAHGKPLLELPQAQRLAFLQKVHDEAAAAEKKQADNEVPPSERKRPFVLMMKELTLLGFFVSKPGATQVLQYVAVPGGFRACIPIAQAGNGKQWATETSLRF